MSARQYPPLHQTQACGAQELCQSLRGHMLGAKEYDRTDAVPKTWRAELNPKRLMQ